MPENNLLTAPRPSPWLDYWERDELWSRSRLWEINSRIFFERVLKLIHIHPQDKILDIGCGSGYLEALLAPRVASITAVDTSEKFVRQTGERCGALTNVSVCKLGKDYTDLSGLGKFSVILCHSVVQYYRDFSEVETLIRSAMSVAMPEARILIADLPLKRNFFEKVWDGICSLSGAFRGGFAAEMIRMAGQARKGTDYASFAGRHSCLEFSIRDLKRMIAKLGLNAEIVRTSLSIYANRPSLLIQVS